MNQADKQASLQAMEGYTSQWSHEYLCTEMTAVRCQVQSSHTSFQIAQQKTTPTRSSNIKRSSHLRFHWPADRPAAELSSASVAVRRCWKCRSPDQREAVCLQTAGWSPLSINGVAIRGGHQRRSVCVDNALSPWLGVWIKVRTQAGRIDGYCS